MVAAACAAGFVASAVLNILQFQHAQGDKKLLQGQITDLQYQVNLDHASPTPGQDASAVTVTPAAATPTPAPSATPAVAGSAAVSLGAPVSAKLTASDPVADLTYWTTTSGSYQVVSLTTESLKKYPACAAGAANSALGEIVRKNVNASAGGTLIKSLGGAYFFYLPPAGNCATDDAGKSLVETYRDAVKNTVLPTLSL